MSITILPRSAWGAAPPRASSTDPYLAVSMASRTHIVVHHGASGEGNGREDVARVIRAYQNTHFRAGMRDIGYHYAVDAWGRIWQLRPHTERGAHSFPNTPAIGIVYVGDGRHNFTPAALNALKQIIAHVDRLRSRQLPILPHSARQATACPGDLIRRAIPTLRTGGTSTPAAPGQLVVDGAWGSLTTSALQRALGVTADGVIGPITTRALQTALNAAGASLEVDGAWGPLTTRALQRALGVAVDGVIGSQTTTALQRALNAKNFPPKPAPKPESTPEPTPEETPVAETETPAPVEPTDDVEHDAIDEDPVTEAEAEAARWELPDVTVTAETEAAAAGAIRGWLRGDLAVGDAVIARLRTFIPIAVGPLLAWLALQVPGAFEWLDANLDGWVELVYGAVSAGASAAYWAAARWLGRRWPVAERILLGSSEQPHYGSDN